MREELSKLLAQVAQVGQEDVLAAHVEELYTFPRVVVREDGVYIEQSPGTSVQVATKETREALNLQPGEEIESFTVTEEVHGERTITIGKRVVLAS